MCKRGGDGGGVRAHGGCFPPRDRPDVRGAPQGIAHGSYGHHPTGRERTDLPRPSCSSQVPAATERKRSPDAPGMTFPRNIKKVWSAGCGHQRLQRKQLGGSPKAARGPQCLGRGLGGQHLQPDWSRARVCVETKRRRALPPPPPGRLGTCSSRRRNRSPAHQQLTPPHKLAPPCSLCWRLR